MLNKEEESTFYTVIKAVLISLDGPSFQESVEKFLELPNLQNGEKLSSYLQHLCSWMPNDSIKPTLMFAVFLSKMTVALKKLLLTQENLSLQKLAAYGNHLERVSGSHSLSCRVICVQPVGRDGGAH